MANTSSFELVHGKYKPFKEGNWKIRAKLEHPKPSDKEKAHG